MCCEQERKKGQRQNPAPGKLKWNAAIINIIDPPCSSFPAKTCQSVLSGIGC